MVFPQNNDDWDVGINADDSVGNHYNYSYLRKDGFQVNFITQLVQRLKLPLDEDHEYIYEDKDMDEDINKDYRFTEVSSTLYVFITLAVFMCGLIATTGYKKWRKH